MSAADREQHGEEDAGAHHDVVVAHLVSASGGGGRARVATPLPLLRLLLAVLARHLRSLRRVLLAELVRLPVLLLLAVLLLTVLLLAILLLLTVLLLGCWYWPGWPNEANSGRSRNAGFELRMLRLLVDGDAKVKLSLQDSERWQGVERSQRQIVTHPLRCSNPLKPWPVPALRAITPPLAPKHRRNAQPTLALVSGTPRGYSQANERGKP